MWSEALDQDGSPNAQATPSAMCPEPWWRDVAKLRETSGHTPKKCSGDVNNNSHGNDDDSPSHGSKNFLNRYPQNLATMLQYRCGWFKRFQ